MKTRKPKTQTKETPTTAEQLALIHTLLKKNQTLCEEKFEILSSVLMSFFSNGLLPFLVEKTIYSNFSKQFLFRNFEFMTNYFAELNRALFPKSINNFKPNLSYFYDHCIKAGVIPDRLMNSQRVYECLQYVQTLNYPSAHIEAMLNLNHQQVVDIAQRGRVHSSNKEIHDFFNNQT